MNDALRLGGLTVAAALFVLLLRRADKQTGAVVGVCAGIMLLFTALNTLEGVAEALKKLSQQAGLTDGTVAMLLKMLGVAFITEFAAQLCRDVGEDGLSQKAALCGKLMLLSMTVPLLTQIGQMVIDLIPS